MKIHKQRILYLAIILVLIFSGCSEQGTKIDDNRDSISTKDTIIEEKTAVDEISSIFRESGYTVMCESVEQQILTGKRYLLTLSGASDGRITLYEYDDSVQAQADGSRIDESGSQVILTNETGTETTYIEWKSTPHFYQLNNLIVQYVGTDKTILTILTNLCGNQFAGGNVE
jgi:hypothetical protein